MGKVYRQWKIQYKWEHPFLPRSEFSFDKYLKWKRNRTKRYREWKTVYRLGQGINKNFNWTDINGEDWKILKERMDKKGIKD